MTQNDALPTPPSSLAQIWQTLRAAGVPEADQVAWRRRLLSLQIRTAAVDRQTLLIVESVTPLQAAGHWMPELAELVGADLVISRKGADPIAMTLAEIATTAPDLIIVACSGGTLEDNIGFAAAFAELGVPVYAADATFHFWVPDAHIVETAEILAEILHKDERLHFGHHETLWRAVSPLNPRYPQG
jgi:ABC-type Fe3+-hydroxamate transport system substrate-binding protein